jgi:hypothetical protein
LTRSFAYSSEPISWIPARAERALLAKRFPSKGGGKPPQGFSGDLFGGKTRARRDQWAASDKMSYGRARNLLYIGEPVVPSSPTSCP